MSGKISGASRRRYVRPMARGKSHSRSAALALRAPAAGAPVMEDTMSFDSAAWMRRPGVAAAPAPARRARCGRATALAAACAVASAGWLAAAQPAQAAVGDAPAADCVAGVSLALETAPPAKIVNDGAGVERWSYTICARQTVARIQTRIARLKDPRLDASEANLESVTPSENLSALYGSRSYSVPAGLAAGSYAVEVAYFTPDGRLADRAASVFRVAAAATPTPPPPSPDPPVSDPPATPPAATPPAATPPALAVPPATPRAESPQRAKLRLVKRGDRTVAKEGGRVRWTLKLSSVGPVAARNVALCDALPSGLVLVSAPGARLRGGEVCWSFKSMPKGTTRKVTLTTKVAGQLSGTTMITNRARATASNADTVNAKANLIGTTTNRRVTAPVTG